jgi:hypothetical protein
MLTHPRWPKSMIAYLLTFILVGGAVMPSPWLWQCHHASHIVFGPVAPSSMPCHMDMDAMSPGMPCCRIINMTAVRHPSTQSVISEPNCHPTLTEMAQRLAQRTDAQPRLKIASVQATDISYVSPAVLLHFTTPLIRCPQDSSAPPGYHCSRSIAPRAPPVA